MRKGQITIGVSIVGVLVLLGGVVTKSSGKISQGFLDLTEGYTFAGGVTSTATTSLSVLNVSGTSTFSNGTSFSQIPTTTTTSHTTSTQLTSKAYTDLTYPAFISSSTVSVVVNSGTITSSTATTTVPTTAHYGVLNVTLTTIDNGAQAGTFTYTIETLRQGATSASNVYWLGASGVNGTLTASIAGNVLTVTMTGQNVSTGTHSYTISGVTYWF